MSYIIALFKQQDCKRQYVKITGSTALERDTSFTAPEQRLFYKALFTGLDRATRLDFVFAILIPSVSRVENYGTGTAEKKQRWEQRYKKYCLDYVERWAAVTKSAKHTNTRLSIVHAAHNQYPLRKHT